VLVPELAGDAAFRARMIRESQAAAAVGHPHIIPVYEAGEADGTAYIAMRYVRGEDARSRLKRLGPLPAGHAWHIVAQVAAALDAAHARGLIHRDVRPANILIEGGDDEPGHAYLADFGGRGAFPPGQVIAASQWAGALDYLAPEQIEGRALDGRTDLYALACTGFELLCGTPPFGQDEGATLVYAQLYAPPPAATAMRADLPAAVDLVLATALNKNPADRYRSCGKFAEELRAALGLSPGEPVRPPRPRSPGRSEPAAESGLPAAGLPAAGLPAAELPATELPAAEVPATAEISVTEVPAAEELPATKAPAAGPGPLGPPGPEAMAESGALEPGAPEPDRPEPGAPEPEVSGTRSRVPKLILAAGAVVVVAAAVASGVALSGQRAPARPAASLPRASSLATASSSSRSPSHAPASSPASPSAPVLASGQAAALGTLLTSSTVARTELAAAVVQVDACTNLSSAVSQLQDVVNQRAGEYSQASALPTAALPGGAAMKSELLGALSNSLQADRDYLTWAQQQQTGGCAPAGQSSAYNAAYGASQLANAAKEEFVQAWNPVAVTYGIKPVSAGSI
jgi:serine/threonine-protein kinase